MSVRRASIESASGLGVLVRDLAPQKEIKTEFICIDLLQHYRRP